MEGKLIVWNSAPSNPRLPYKYAPMWHWEIRMMKVKVYSNTTHYTRPNNARNAGYKWANKLGITIIE